MENMEGLAPERIDEFLGASEEIGFVGQGRQVMRRGADTIVVKRNRNGHYVFFSVRDDRDHGTIINFLQRRQKLSLGAVRQALRPWIGKPALPLFPKLKCSEGASYRREKRKKVSQPAFTPADGFGWPGPIGPGHRGCYFESREVVMTDFGALLRDHVTLRCRSIDRIFLQAYVPKLRTVGLVCTFLRWQRKFKIPSSVAFGKIGEEYVKAVYRFAEAHHIPVVHFKKGQDKEKWLGPIWKQRRTRARTEWC